VRLFVGIAAALLIVAGAIGVWTAIGTDGKGKTWLRGEITFGVLAPTTGPGNLPERGKDLIDGANMAASEINGQGGLLGHRLALIVLDDGCSPPVAYEAAKAFAGGSGVAGVVGGICDDAASREIPVIDASGIPFLVTAANRSDLITRDITFAYLMNGTGHQQALSAVYWMNYRSAQRLAVVADSSPGSRALADGAIRLVDQAPEVVNFQVVPSGQMDMKKVARSALASSPDFVYWTGSAPSGGALAKALRGLGFKGTFTGSAASESPEFLEAAGPRGAEGAFVTATAGPQNLPNAVRWRERFQAAYGHAPGVDALQAYDAVGALAQAIRQAGDTSSAKVKAGLTHLSESFTTFLGVLRFARDHTLLYDNRIILAVKKGAFAWERSLRTDSLQ
jgi:branched-chain amino acid transport system substrate-binding protein